MIYIFDTSSIIVLCSSFYPSRFPTLWNHVNALVANAQLLSVRDVKNELNSYHSNTKPAVVWANANPKIFTIPKANEMVTVATILGDRKFKNVISQKQILAGRPFADPFVVAKAKEIGGTVVTQEVARPNSAKIPDICAYYNVACCDLEGFMISENLRF